VKHQIARSLKASPGFLSLTLYSQVVPFVEQLTYEFMAMTSLYPVAESYAPALFALAGGHLVGSLAALYISTPFLIAKQTSRKW
jgi:hypothetical protein